MGAQRVALNVSGHNPEMLVAFHWERLVSTLVDMAQSRIAPVFLPATHMGDRQPLMKAANSPSHSGHKSRCQWLGITAYAQIRIGSVIDQEYPAKPARMLGSRPLSRTTAFAPLRDSRREKPFHQERPALFVASPNHNPKLPILSISYLSRSVPLSRFPDGFRAGAACLLAAAADAGALRRLSCPAHAEGHGANECQTVLPFLSARPVE